MTKESTKMRRDIKVVKAAIRDAAVPTLSRWADCEGRTFQRHLGFLLEKLAAIYQSKPEELREMGLIPAAPAPHKSAA
jgi:hypothetical protein